MNSVSGFLAFMAVWIAMMAIGEIALGIRAFGYIAMWGYLSGTVSFWIADWAKGK